jgi:hypothetical protein
MKSKEPKEIIKDLLENKAALKQDVFEDTKRHFDRFKEHIRREIASLRESVKDERVRLSCVDNGDFEIQVFIGSDVLIYHMHTNIFRLPDENPLWKTEYMMADKQLGYFGIINIYNFLADSYLKNRLNDIGYLIGRIFINKEEHFMIEGKGQLGFLFRDLTATQLNDAIMCHVIHVSFMYALEFDLLTPPYEMISKVSVVQMLEINSNDKMSTGKRLGFKFEAEDKDIF